jgi:putative ABC transport system permease protein
MAAVPLFLSSVGTGSVGLQASERCPRDTGVTQLIEASAPQVTSPPRSPFASLGDLLGPSNRWLRLEDLPMAGRPGAKESDVSVLLRDDALAHIDVLEGSTGPGLLLSTRAAEESGLGAGDHATIGGVSLPVAGVYSDLSGTTVDDYWCSTSDMLMVEVRGADMVLPPPLLLADPDTFVTLMRGLDGVHSAPGAWEAPLHQQLTVAQAGQLVHALACGSGEDLGLPWCTGAELPPVGTTSGRFRQPVHARDDAHFVEQFLHSHLPFVIQRSKATQAAVGGGVWPVSGLAALAGIGLVAASASLWFDRRRREVTLLAVRGASPVGLGLKAVLELALPSMLGAAAGVLLAYGAVAALGPSPVLEPAAVGQAVLVGALALLLVVVTVAGVVARRVRGHEDRRRRRWAGAIPWELALAGATLVSYHRLGRWGVPVGRGAQVTRVDVWGLLFPVLFIVTVVAALSRILAVTLRPLRAVSRSWPSAPYLGVRRVARYRAAVLGLLAASATAAGVLGYAVTIDRSLDATLRVKVLTYVGSDTAVRVTTDQQPPPALAARATKVTRHQQSWMTLGQRRSVTVVGLDPATFAQAAFWDPSSSDEALPEILRRLARPPGGGPVPAVVVGARLGGPVEVGVVEGHTTRFEVQSVAQVSAFPGMKRPEATIYVAQAALDDLGVVHGSTELWIAGDHPETLAALRQAGTAFVEDRRADDVADGAAFQTVSWTFGFMRSLGVAAGLLVVAGLAVYLDARRRERVLAYAFARRMGLTRRQHRAALAVELIARVVVGCCLGLGIANIAAWLAHGRLDPVPGFRPGPVLRLATTLDLALVGAVVGLAALAAVLAQRRIDGDDPVEVLRAGA